MTNESQSDADIDCAMELLYTDIVRNFNITLKIAPYEILHNYPFWKITELPKDAIEFVPIFKNPCFFARTKKTSCREFDPHCGQIRLQCLPYFFIVSGRIIVWYIQC